MCYDMVLEEKITKKASVTMKGRHLVRVLVAREWLQSRDTCSIVMFAKPTSGAWGIQGRGQGHSREEHGTY